MGSSDLILSIDKTQNVSILLGGTTSFNVTVQNLSTTQRFYNLSFTLALPDGMSFSSATITQTSTLTNTDGSSLISWTNLKDLAPLEEPYKFTITVKANTTFKSGTTIPFGYIFSGISFGCQVDTMPRGNYDIGNEVITKTSSMTFKSVRFYGTVSTSGKVLKGAGSSKMLNDYTKVYTATYIFYNNALSTSTINITILLPDGIRYIGNLTTSGTDAKVLTTPVISTVIINGVTYTQLYFGGVTLSLNSATTLNLSYAVWNKYNANQGNLITHGTAFNLKMNMASIEDSVDSSTLFTAMDVIITTSTSKVIVDVTDAVTYTYNILVGQYYDISNIVVNYFLSDGIYYLSSSVTPTSVVDSKTLQGFTMIYNFALAIKNSQTTVTISAKVDSYYRYKQNQDLTALPVVSFDSFLATATLSGTLFTLGTVVTDNASCSSSINTATISKQFLKAYYRNGTAKTISSLAPNDLAEYRLTYNASTLKATQKQVSIDDFFPLSANPIDNLMYTYTGFIPTPTSPKPIDPHGQDFFYGDIPGLTSSTITYKVPISFLGSTGQNNNLMKLKGINTLGIAYSNRSQVLFNIGTPNLSLTKSVVGPNKSAIKAGEVYSYTVKISNSNTLKTETDAFNFDVTDNLSTWFTYNPNSVSVSGTGSYTLPVVDLTANTIKLSVTKLAPGQSLTLTYSVTIMNTIAPGISIATAVTNTNPYSQVYDAQQTNFQYSNLIKTASTTISSAAIMLIKTNAPATYKVGSSITYTLTVTIPQGTTAYNVYVKDTLLSGSQVYLGPASLNGNPIAPTVSNNVITFPNLGTLNATVAAQTLVYTFVAKIINGTKSVGATTSTQNNIGQVIYQQTPGGTNLTISKTLAVTINHPNLLMNLSAINATTSEFYATNASINLSTVLNFTLTFQNNSTIKLVNGTIEIPISTNFSFGIISSTIQCSATYNITSKKIIITVPSLDANASGFITFTASPQSPLRAGTAVTLQATATAYYNDTSITKVYSGEKSNLFTCTLPASVSLLPTGASKVNDSTSYQITQPGGTIIINNILKNTGGGYDNYTLIIQPVALSYQLYIDNQLITTVAKNTLYQATLSSLSNLAPNQSKTLTINSTFPTDSSLGTRFDFIVNAKSTTAPYPEKTVLNIDPN